MKNRENVGVVAKVADSADKDFLHEFVEDHTAEESMAYSIDPRQAHLNHFLQFLGIEDGYWCTG